MKQPFLVVLAATVAATGFLLFGAGPAAATTSVVRPDSGSGCTAANPEVCFGIDGHDFDVNWMQVQAHTNNAGIVSEWITDPNGNLVGNVQTYGMSGAGWVPADRVTLNQDVLGGWYCGHASYQGIEAPDYCILVS